MIVLHEKLLQKLLQVFMNKYMGLHKGSLWSLRRWSAPRILDIRFLFVHPISTVPSLEATRRRSTGPSPNLSSTRGGDTSAMEASSPSPSCPLGDETVRWAKPASTPTASLPVSRLSSSQETGLVGGRPTAPSSTSMAWSSLGGEPETGAEALSEGTSLAPGAVDISTSAPWSSRSSLSGMTCSGMSS